MKTINLREKLFDFFLIVVGILVALWINNWNEVKKNKATLHSSFVAIQANLKEDIANMEDHIVFNQNVLDHIQFAFKVMALPEYKQKPFTEYADSLFNVGLERTFLVSKTAFHSMESGGHFQLFENQNLARSIFKYYSFLDEIQQVTEVNNQFVQLLIEPFIYTEVEIRVFSPVQKGYLKPDIRPFRGISHKIVRDNLKFENFMVSRMFRLENENRRFKEGIEHAQKLLKEIQNKIN